MARSISSRIFTGFLVVTFAFASVMGYTVYRMHGVRQHLELINDAYLRLNRVCNELHFKQVGLVYQVGERAAGRITVEKLRQLIKVARKYRLNDVRKALRLTGRIKAFNFDEDDRRFVDTTLRTLRGLDKAFRADEALFEAFFSTDETAPATLQQVGDRLLRGERKLLGLTRSLRARLRGRVKATAAEMVAAQQTAVASGLLLVLGAIVLSLAITFRARLLLRPLKTLVASAKHIGAGDYAERVEVSSRDELGLLAEEFNNMAAAVQERETKLILSEKMAAAGQLASHITHEVRNPLNSISLNTELLEEELGELDSGSTELQSLCKAIRKEVDRLTGITEEYLSFARMPKPVLQHEDVNEILSSLLSFISPELEARGVELQTNLADLPLIEVDENQLRGALLNLVRNAGEAMTDGGTLRVDTRRNSERIEIAIGDTGPGINAADLGKVFDPFFSTKSSGTGLGLARTHRVIAEHGGQIAVSSDSDGTTFTIKLPLDKPQEHDARSR